MKNKQYQDILKEINKAPSQWSSDEMCKNLSKFSLNFFKNIFKKNQIDGRTFLNMKNFEKITEDDNDSSSDNEKMLTFQKQLKIYNDSFDEKVTLKFKNRQKTQNSDSEEQNKKPEKKITYLDSETETDDKIKEKNNVESETNDKNKLKKDVDSESDEVKKIPQSNNNKKEGKKSIKEEIEKYPSQWTVDELCENLSDFFQSYLRKNKIDGKKFLALNFENEEIGICFYQNHLINLEEKNMKKIKEKKIPLVLNYQNIDYEIKKTCTIGRSADCNIQIKENSKVSRTHAIINMIDSNYFIKNKSGENGTFIKLMPENRLKIYQDMCLDVGSHFIKILSLSNLEIQLGFSTEIDFNDMQSLIGTFGDKKKIIFGKNPPKSKSHKNIEFSDNSLADQHGVFKLIEDEDYYEIELHSLKSDKEIWFKLENLQNEKSKFPFCRLIPNMTIKISEELFTVINTNLSPLKNCFECNESINSVYLNCFHSVYCFHCAKNKFKENKKCNICQNDIDSIQKIIDISN